jgi:hypothetical protein
MYPRPVDRPGTLGELRPNALPIRDIKVCIDQCCGNAVDRGAHVFQGAAEHRALALI